MTYQSTNEFAHLHLSGSALPSNRISFETEKTLFSTQIADCPLEYNKPLYRLATPTVLLNSLQPCWASESMPKGCLVHKHG